MALLKYLKNNISFKDIPKTLRNEELGKMLINYLFGHSIIKSMNFEEE